MAHIEGVCPKHQSLRRPVTDCEDCKEAQRQAMLRTAKSRTA